MSSQEYNRVLFIALGTLILTPQLLKMVLRWAGVFGEGHDETYRSRHESRPVEKAVVIGIGPISRQVASRLETMGVDVCVVDLSPINLHSFAQQGFHNVAGDARDVEVLRRADAAESRLAVVCVPDDDVANQIVGGLREVNPAASILVRCRYKGNIAAAERAEADTVASEETEASTALLKLCERVVQQADTSLRQMRPREVSRGRGQ